MNTPRQPSDVRPTRLRWVARVASIIVGGSFLLIGLLAILNEDPPQGMAIVVLSVLFLNLIGCLAAWRWPRIGGALVVAGSLLLAAAAFIAGQSLKLGALSLLPALLYGVPFLSVGLLFWLTSAAHAGSAAVGSGAPTASASPPPTRSRWWLVAAPAALLLVALAVLTLGLGAPFGGLLRRSDASAVILQGHDDPVQSVAYSPDGALLVSADRGGGVLVWCAADRALLQTLPVFVDADIAYSHDLAFAPDGERFALGLPDGTVHLWRLSVDAWNGECPSHLVTEDLPSLLFGSHAVQSIGFSPDGRLLAAGDADGALALWDVESATTERTWAAHAEDVTSVAFSPDGEMLASASFTGKVKLWDAASGELVRTLETPSAAMGVAFSPDGSTLAVAGSADHGRQLWRVADGRFIRELESARGGMGGVAFSPDGTLVAAGNGWHEVRWWRAADGALLHVGQGHADSVNSVAFSPDGQTLVSGSLDGTLRLWAVP